LIGKTISHYKIIEKLGEGGMGVVYKAQDLKLDRFVALKFLPHHFTTSEEVKQRFIQEAKAASSLDHNNICAIYEIDETEDGHLFISMAYYEGETLDKKLKEKPQPINDAIDITIQIAQGLTKAHEKEIVHRDIKPANIILTSDSVVKILDFGLAKLSTQTKLTKEGSTVGTISYMSPEQARGDKVDHRTDIWSMGVILYEMLSGQLPFEGDYDQAVVYSIINDEPQTMTGLRTGVPMELERIISKCLQKNPAKRYQHVDELAVDLLKLQKEPESASTPQKKGTNTRRTKTVIVSLAILSILILAIAGYYFIYERDKSEIADVAVSKWENSIAVLPFENISNDPEQEYFCNGMTEQVISNLGRLPNLKVSARQSVMKYKDSDKTIPEIGKELNVAHILESSIRKFGNRIRVTAQLIKTDDGFHIWSQDFDKEYHDLFDIQDDISEKIATNLFSTLSPQKVKDIKMIRPSNTETYEYYIKGRYFHVKFTTYSKMEDFSTAEKMLRAAIKLDPKFAISYAELADLYNTYYNYFELIHRTKEGKDKYMQLQEAYLDTAMQLDSNSPEVFYTKCWIHHARGEIDDAIESAKKAYKINRNFDRAYYALSIMLSLRGLHNLSIKCLSIALKINPLYYIYYVRRAIAYNMIGEYEDAEIDIQKAIELEPYYEFALRIYSVLLIELKKLDQAKQVTDKYRKLYPDREHNYLFEAALYAVSGEKDKALSVNINNKYHKFIIYSLLEMKEESIQYLNEDFDRVKNRNDTWYLLLKNHLVYDFLRSVPRFQEILAKHKQLYEENLEKYGDIDI
jgi:serine/threonine protein kinase